MVINILQCSSSLRGHGWSSSDMTSRTLWFCVGPLLAQTDHEPVPQGRVLWFVSSQNSPGFERKEQFLKGNQEELWSEGEWEVCWEDTTTVDPLPCFPFDSRGGGSLTECVQYIRHCVSSCGCKKSLGHNVILYPELQAAISSLTILSVFDSI